MKKFNALFGAAAAAMLLFSCQKNIDTQADRDLSADQLKKNGISGYVYTLSNQTASNDVLVYSRTAGGVLDFVDAYPTGGTGTGGGLGSQEAVILTDNNKWLLAVNAGSNTISSLRVSGSSLMEVSTVSSGGTMPISITEHHGIVYVLNAGGTGNISGFMLYPDGTLSPIAGSTRPLSSPMAGPAQVSFVADGSSVVVTEKATNRIISYTIDNSGMPGAMHWIMAANATPFGFAVGKKNVIYVSEAAGGGPGASTVSSYHVNGNGMISLVEGPVGAGQTAACWVVITNNGKYVYATNTGSNNISSFRANNSGSLSVLEAAAAGTGAGPIDAALSNNSKFLYELNAGSHTISGFAVSNDGSLDAINTVSGLPEGAAGLAAK